MTLLVLLLGLIITTMGVLGMVSPDRMMSLARSFQTDARIYMAAVFRVFFGIVLIVAAPECRAPGVIRVLGIVTLVAGVLVAAIGPERVRAMIGWWLGMPQAAMRAWAVVAGGLGLFLVYAAV